MRTFMLAVTGLVFAVAACSSYGTSVVEVGRTRAQVASVSLSVPSSLAAGQTARAIATPKDASGAALTDRPVTWYTSSASIANVSDSGIISAVAPGTAVVSAVSEGIAGQASMAVVPPPPTPIATVAVAINPSAVLIGQTAQATAILADSSGNQISGRTVIWSSSDLTVATVDTITGTVTAVGPGQSMIKASTTGKSNSSRLSVSAPAPIPVASVSVSPTTSTLQIGGTVQLSAVTRDANNNILTGRVINWGSGNTGIATVSASGLVTAVAAGNVSVTASSEGQTASAAITVSAPAPVPVASVSVSPATSSLLVGATVQLSATTRDANSNVLTGRVIAWSSSNTSISTVSASGLVTAIAAGSATITATSETKTGTAAITVSAPAPVPVASVTVSPATPSLTVGGTVQFSAVTRDANNNILTGRSITWSSNNLAVATVSASALGTAVAVGTAQVTATSEGKVGSGTLTVTSPPPPPPPGSSNEPAGMTTLTDRPFNTANELGWTDWWPGGLMTFVSDATAPHSPSGILRATYPTGYVAGSAPGAWDPPMSGNKKTVYLAVWVKHSANWFGQSTGTNKIFYFHTSTNDAPVFYFTAEGVGNGNLVPYIALQATVSPGESNLNPNLVPSAVIPRGQWNLIEVVAVGNSPGNRDGSIDWYVNGVHVGSYAVEFESGGTTWQRISFAPVWGGQGGAVPATQTLDFDHAYLSVK
jgi:uncharacterized protein YjdB